MILSHSSHLESTPFPTIAVGGERAEKRSKKRMRSVLPEREAIRVVHRVR